MDNEQKPKAEWRRLFSYGWIIKHFSFILFLAVLAIVYIANGHLADKTIRNINRSARELKELQYEYKNIKSELMFRSKQSELVKAVQVLGLEELGTPPMKLVDSSLFDSER